MKGEEIVVADVAALKAEDRVSVSATEGVTLGDVTYKYVPDANTVVDADYAHITVSATSVSDGTNTMAVTDIASDATGIASAAAVYSFAVTAEAISDTTDYEDIFA